MEIVCETCAAPRQRRLTEVRRSLHTGKGMYCSHSCSAHARAQKYHVPASAASKSTRLRRAHNIALGLWPHPWECEGCAGPATDVHHRDRDNTNNEAHNLSILCRGCHVTLHNRAKETGRGKYGR